MSISRQPLPPIESFHYLVERVVSEEMLSRLQIEMSQNYELENVVVRVTRKIATWRANETLVIQYPANWWQSFKQRFFPQWALKRWPVLLTTHTYRAVAYLPTIPVPNPRDRELAMYGWIKDQG